MTQVDLLSADIDVLKLVDTPAAAAGETVWYTVIVKNLGDLSTETGVWSATLIDDLPAGVTLEPDSIQLTRDPGIRDLDCQLASGDLICFFDVGADWESSELHLRYAVTVNPGVPMGTLLNNKVTVDDSFGILTSGEAIVEVLGAHHLYLPLVVK